MDAPIEKTVIVVAPVEGSARSQIDQVVAMLDQVSQAIYDNPFRRCVGVKQTINARKKHSVHILMHKTAFVQMVKTIPKRTSSPWSADREFKPTDWMWNMLAHASENGITVDTIDE